MTNQLITPSNPQTGPDSNWTTITGTTDSQTAHTSLVSIGVIILVTIILVELAGVNKDWAAFAGSLFLGVILIKGMTDPGALSSISKYPAAP